MNVTQLGTLLIKIAIKHEPDIVTARQKMRRLSQLLGFDTQDQARLATAVSELARNVFQYAGSGHVELFFADLAPQAIFVKVSDQGPGIRNLDDILNGTYVSKSGMGVGLMGTKKLMDHFNIETTPGKGTAVTIGKLLDKRARRIEKDDLKGLIDRFILRQPESPFEEIQNQNRDLLCALEEVKTAQDELAELNRELAETNRGVVALYAELDEKAASLQRANEVKTSFLSNMTHEFRTPLSAVISLTRLLLSKVDGELTTEQEKQVQYIRQSAEGLLELVNDLLDLAKVEAGKVSINSQEFFVDEVLTGLRGMFRPVFGANHPVEFNIELPKSIFSLHTDQAKVSQILRNLVSNAMKFTESGAVTVTVQLEADDLVHFTVVDTGVGIDEAHIDSIFEDFSQVDSYLQKRQKGTGLGLPLSRKLARLLGGDLWARSGVGVGSRFHVAIPRVYTGGKEGVLFGQAARPVGQPVGGIPAVEASFRVLIVDDDEASRYVIKSLVSREIDARFSEATTGQAGIKSIRQWKPDLVFLDLSMPELDGFGVLQEIARDSALAALPVIVNTAKKLSAGETEFLMAHSIAVLSKERLDDQQAVNDLRTALQKAGFDYRRR